jgi:serralysin
MRSLLLVVLLVLAAAPARALFHLWDVSEVFSDASGDVQFIELSTASSSQQFVGDHLVRTRDGGAVLETFTIPDDLPGSSTNRRFLLATPGFLAVAGIEPDFTIPAGFIELGVADEIDFADVDSFPLAGLPTDGALALQRGGATAAASPTNFAGEVGTIDLPEPEASCLGMAVATVLAGLAAWQARRAGKG